MLSCCMLHTISNRSWSTIAAVLLQREKHPSCLPVHSSDLKPLPSTLVYTFMPHVR
jgi:hypothetical protein